MNDLEEKSPASDLTSDFQAESRKESGATISRMIQAIGGKGKDELASFLGISKDAIYKAERQAIIPPYWFLDVGKVSNISIDWLVTGEGPMHRGAAAASPAEPQALTPKAEEAPVAMRMEPARAGMLRAGGMLETPTPETYAAQVGEIAALRQENRELRQENRELRQENRELMKENADLRVAVAEMRARAAPERDASKEMPGEEARKSA